MIKDNLWNIVLTTLATAILGLLGWTLLHVVTLEQSSARRDATEFTKADALILQRDITKIVTDVDMRLRLIERDIHWLKGGGMGMGAMMAPLPDEGWDAAPPGGDETSAPEPDPDPDLDLAPPPPRYQLDSVKQQAEL